MGSYGIILSLLGCLDHGLSAKKLVDRVIDSCKCFVMVQTTLVLSSLLEGDHVTNLREDIFIHRIKYSLTTTMDESERDSFLNKAAKALEK